MSEDTLNSALNVKINNRPGYNMNYYREYLGNYSIISNTEKFLNNEKFYDKLSIMGMGESPAQWKLRVKYTLHIYYHEMNIAYTIVSACLQDLAQASLMLIIPVMNVP